MFDSIDEVVESLSELFSLNHYELMNKNNIMNLILNPGISIKELIDFKLKEKKEENEKIKDLISTTRSLIDRITILEKENKKLKEDVVF